METNPYTTPQLHIIFIIIVLSFLIIYLFMELITKKTPLKPTPTTTEYTYKDLAERVKLYAQQLGYNNTALYLLGHNTTKPDISIELSHHKYGLQNIRCRSEDIDFIFDYLQREYDSIKK